MLVSLRVRDLAVLEDVDLVLEPGLTVLTGETGAGKSLVVDALTLLSGERADTGLVRAGAEKLVVEGCFESDDPSVGAVLAGAGLGPGEGAGVPTEVVVRREVAPGGKGRLFIDGSPAALRTLSELAPRLLVLYGQAEARDLLDPAAPREVLDRFAALAGQAADVSALHRSWQALEAERERLAGKERGRAERLELVEYQLREIDTARPVAGEEEALGAEKLALSSVERRGRLLGEAVAALEGEPGGALPALSELRRTLQDLAELDATAGERVAQACDLVERASDLAASLSRSLDRLEGDPARLAAVVERLDALARLRRKHGPTLADVLEHRGRIAAERDELLHLEKAVARAGAAAAAAREAYREAAVALSAGRVEAAPRLSAAVEAHLRDLAFLSSSFRVVVACRPDPDGLPVAGQTVACGPHGIDAVTLSFAPNPGEPARSLAKIASGGELSRVQLALAAALAEGEAARGGRLERSARGGPVRTFVFDEVDAGVSGATAEAVGRKLRTLAAREQVLVVTHLPQVAAAGTHHLSVAKETSGGRTRTRVRPLDGPGRVEAVAAMLAGSAVTEPAREQARTLLGLFAPTPRRRVRAG